LIGETDMFRSPVAADPLAVHDVVDPPEELVPLSVLTLDLPAPDEGWNTYLNRRSIPVAEDDLGRAAVARSVARMLIAERRQAELEQARKREEVERLAVEADHLRRAQIWKGLPSDQLPVGAHPAAAMLAAAQDARPRRTSVLREALAGESLTFHSFGSTPDEE
jgi:hypothetical protein